MKEKKLEQVLEEALSAYIEGGRTREDILCEHAAYRGHLEPLLSTAIETYEEFQARHPSTAAQQRGLARFLADARARASLRSLARKAG